MMTREITLTLPKPHRGQAPIIESAARFRVLCCGRRFGKSLLGLDRAIDTAIHGYSVGWFSPTYKMLSEIWRQAIEILTPVTKRTSSQEMRIELITGGVLDFWSLDNPDSARGRKYKRVVIDEAAMVIRLQEAWQNVIRPTLTDMRGDGLFLSTPKGFNFFKTLFDYGNDPQTNDWQSWQLPTLTNPHLPADEIEAARLELPERVFRQEYLAEFITDGSFFVGIDAAAVAQEQLVGIPQHTYVIGADWARSSGGDYTVFSVIDATTKEQVAIERYNGMDYITQQNRLKALSHRFNDAHIQAEYNSMGGPLVEQLQRDGLRVTGFTTTAATKHEIITNLHLGLERGDLMILNYPPQIAELKAYEARQRAGLPSYSAPDGGHDDTVIALALAWYATGNGDSMSDLPQDDRETISRWRIK